MLKSPDPDITSILLMVRSGSTLSDMKKSLLIALISIVGILVVAGGVVGALWLFNGSQNETSNDDQEFVEKDLGTCQLVTRDSVVSALGESVETVGQPMNAGYALDSDGEVQTCYFSLSEEPSPYQRLTVSQTIFENTEAKQLAIKRFAELENIGGIGELTYYASVDMESGEDIPERTLSALYVFSAMELYTFELLMPEDVITLDSEAVQAALQSIAETVDF
jgi:hypothetical protein